MMSPKRAVCASMSALASVLVFAHATPTEAQSVVQPAASPQAVPSALPSPAAIASASPAPTPTPRELGLHVVTDASFTFVSQNAAGPGIFAPEAPGWLAGSVLAPNTPYDLFSSAPQVSGNAGVEQLISQAVLRTRAFDFGVGAGLANVNGSLNNAAYWGENLIPTLNPHAGSRVLPYTPAFPSHPGEDDGSGTRLSILSGSFATADGNLDLRGGWFDLAQTDRFVFAPPALTSVNPAIAYAPPESLSNGLPGLDSWQPLAHTLPLHGVDLVTKDGIATLELTDAALPAPAGQSAQLSMGSVVFDHGEGTRFSGQVVHVHTAGAPFTSAAAFGSDPSFTLYPQGNIVTSQLSGQVQTIAGLRGAFHVMPAVGMDGVVEVGRSWYAATLAARPGSAAPGGFYHAGLIETQGHVAGSVDVYRMEPRYATMMLPYGAAENIWGAAFAWPGLWPVGNYQLVDNSVVATNRQGYRLRASVDKTPVELHLEYTSLRQIESATIDNAEQTGFLDPFFLPQQIGAGTIARQKHLGLWAAWHPAFGDLTLDVVDDTVFRPFVASHPEDGVSFESPQAVVTFARHLSANVVASTGLGRFAIKGADSEPIDFSERLFFAGVEIAQTPRASVLVSFRRTAYAGEPTFPAKPISPDFTGTMLLVEQRLHF
jgi:hypothetical protein